MPPARWRLLTWVLTCSACAPDGAVHGVDEHTVSVSHLARRLPALRPLIADASQRPARSQGRSLVIDAARPATASRERLSVTLGERASQPFVVASGSTQVSVERIGVAAVEARVDQGVALFDGALDGATLLAAARGDGVEELIVADRPGVGVSYAFTLPEGHRLVPHPHIGLVELRDASDSAVMRVWANAVYDADGAPLTPQLEVSGARLTVRAPTAARYPVVVDPFFTGASSMVIPRFGHTLTRLADGRLLVVGGFPDSEATLFLDSAELYDPSTGSFSLVEARLAQPRCFHTTTLLGDGRALVFGGLTSDKPELFDPSTSSFSQLASSRPTRYLHTATLLDDDTVLLAGGGLASAELYHHTDQSFETLPSKLSSARSLHTATKLPSGDVLFAGGQDGDSPSLATIDRYDATTRSLAPFSAKLSTPRLNHTATLLGDGRVLFAGGADSSIDLLDPAKSLLSTVVEALARPRSAHSATLLGDGRVLLAGGQDPREQPGRVSLQSAELFDPATGKASPLRARLTSVREGHEATLLDDGRVLLVGGVANETILRDVELFDPGGVDVELASTKLALARVDHRATTLADGRVLITGGRSDSSYHDTAELYDPAIGSFSVLSARMTNGRALHTATPLVDGRVLLVGGWRDDTSLATSEIFDPSTDRFTELPSQPARPRALHTATRLADGRVLVVGGEDEAGAPVTSAELFDPTSGHFTLVPDAFVPPVGHPAATLLADGSVLMSGGRTRVAPFSLTRSLSLFDPAQNTLTLLPDKMQEPRSEHTATRLDDGRVLIVGGGPITDPGDTAELFSPENGSLGLVDAKLAVAISSHTATLLPDGSVLIAGGQNGAGQHALVHRFYPTSNTLKKLDTELATARANHTASLLPDGSIIVTGGGYPVEAIETAERWSPDSATFTTLAGLAGAGVTLSEVGPDSAIIAGGEGGPSSPARLRADGTLERLEGSVDRSHHAAVVLTDGSVLLSGGIDGSGATLATFEIISPTGALVSAGQLASPRSHHAATRLPDGRVALSGGQSTQGSLASLEIIDPSGSSPPTTQALLFSRARHAARLLADGRLLVVGGVNESGDVPTLEVVDTQNGVSQPVGEATVGAAASVAHVGGDTVMAISGASKSARFDLATSTIFDSSVPPRSKLVPVGPTLTLACSTACQLLGATSDRGGDVALVGLSDDDQMKPIGTSAVAFAGARGGQLFKAMARLTPATTARPTIAPLAERSLRARQRVTLSGSFLLGKQHLEKRASVHWRPLDGAGPVLRLDVERWGEGTVEAIVPQTAFSGPGLLHVAVDQAPSEGQLLTITRALDGESCAVDVHCASGHCVDGLCCDHACADGCFACSAAVKGHGVDGACEAIATGLAARWGCDPLLGELACGPHGTCNGSGLCELPDATTRCNLVPNGRCIAGACSPPPPSECDGSGERVLYADGSEVWCQPYRCDRGACLTACDDDGACAQGAECASGSCTPSCDETGAKIVQLDGPPIPCGVYRCRQGACLDACESDADCAQGARCEDGACRDGCSQDRASVVSISATGPTTRPCAPFRCAEGACITTCQSHDDCVPPARCADDGRCLAAPTPAPARDPGACALPGGPAAPPGPWLAAPLALLVRRRFARRKALR